MTRILLADDDPALRDMVQRALQSDGHSVVAVEDGQEALEKLSRDSFDLLVSDLDMPGLDGMGLAAHVSARIPALKVLLMSGLADELKRAEGFPRDRFATLAKPFTLDQIKAAARKLLAS